MQRSYRSKYHGMVLMKIRCQCCQNLYTTDDNVKLYEYIIYTDMRDEDGNDDHIKRVCCEACSHQFPIPDICRCRGCIEPYAERKKRKTLKMRQRKHDDAMFQVPSSINIYKIGKNQYQRKIFL